MAYLKIHLLRHDGKIACSTNVLGSRSRLSTLAFPKAERDKIPASSRCARCARATTPKPKKELKKDIYLPSLPGESFPDYLGRKRAFEKS